MCAVTPPSAVEFTGARIVRHSGFDGCIELANETTRVVLEPNVGGRVASYALNGREALYQNPAQEGVLWDGKRNIVHPAGGRFDIGPEYGGLSRDEAWFGRWRAEIAGPRSAVLTSQPVTASGLQVQRSFVLAGNSPQLRCTQIIHNRGRDSFRAFHWGRTFMPGGGIAFAPLPVGGRFPRGYALGGPPGVIDFLPGPEASVRICEGILEVLGPPTKAKLVFDASPGWLAYLARSGLLLVKQFEVYPDRPYGELAANNASIWYAGSQNTPAWPYPDYPVEIEPIGPSETITPGASAQFTEEWWLDASDSPAHGPAGLTRIVEKIRRLHASIGSAGEPFRGEFP